MALLEVKDVTKVYSSRFSLQQVTALNGINFSVEEGEFVAIMGESGSGKTTLLNILGLLDEPTQGEVSFKGNPTKQLNNKEVSAFRREVLGYVFQDFNLLDALSVRDNILLPLVLSGQKKSAMEKRLVPVVKDLGIANIVDKYPYEISGGQKQRTAVARALITSPLLILADEPTGSLDSNSSDELMRSFLNLNRQGQTLLMVTHSTKAASYASRVLFIKDGKIFHQIYKGEKRTTQMYEEISQTLSLLARGGQVYGDL